MVQVEVCVLAGNGKQRVLLVTASDDEAGAVAAAFQSEGAFVTRAKSASDAATALSEAGFDITLAFHPLPDADVIGSCATFGQVPGAPPVILIDMIDQRAAIENTVPSEMRPVRVLRKPLDLGKLPALVRKVLDDAPDAGLEAEMGFAPLVLLLAEIHRTHATGTLEVRGDGLCTRVYFENGEPMSAEGGSLRETLGRMLLRTGDISEEDYVRVIDKMTDQIFENEPLRMGEVLIEFGLLSQEAVEDALAHQVGEKLTSCLQWRDTTATFDPDDLPLDPIEPLDVAPIEQLLLAGLRLYVTGDEIREALAADGKKPLKLTTSVDECIRLLGLENADRKALHSIDGKRTLGALVLNEERVHLFGTLIWMGLAAPVERTARPPKAPAPERRGRPEFAREVIMPRKRMKAAAAKKATATQSSADEATEATPAPEENQPRLEAEQLFRRAQSQLDADRFDDAVSTMRRVVDLQPLEPEYRMFESWALYLHTRVEVRIARAKTVAAARRMAEADTKAAVPHAILGTLALEDGDEELARKEFQAALIRDPENEEAQRGIKLVRGAS